MKFNKIFLVAILSILSFQSQKASAQNEQDSLTFVNFFLDCYACDFDFVRQELPFVSFVRDPGLADVHILVTVSHTGSGAHKYFMNFIGMKSFEGMNYEYELTTDPTYTENDTRLGLLKLIKVGVLPYLSQTAMFSKLNVDIGHQKNVQASNLVVDRWNKWIIRLSSGGNVQKEESQNEFSVRSEVRIEKVTEAWKTRMEASYRIDRENFFDEGIKISNNQDEAEIRADYIKSLSPKWSAGVFTEYSASTYLNIDNSLRLSAGLEYNIFPWSDSNRKIFSFGYHAGFSAWDYHEETIYDKLNEMHGYESLELNLELVQPWGNLEANLEGRHYFYDFHRNRLIFESDLSIRLTKQLSVYSEIRAEVVHDQLYLPKGSTSVEDLLLRRRKLATTYEIYGELGFRFTFGSIYSNVVNERF
ncbi:MAG TPA: hypothetical protein VKA38_11680 [Draconibacterium sp.]|nr:hypothetical protein [Draconibacterium sp.]